MQKAAFQVSAKFSRSTCFGPTHRGAASVDVTDARNEHHRKTASPIHINRPAWSEIRQFRTYRGRSVHGDPDFFAHAGFDEDDAVAGGALDFAVVESRETARVTVRFCPTVDAAEAFEEIVGGADIGSGNCRFLDGACG
jgi:hypothetical protein